MNRRQVEPYLLATRRAARPVVRLVRHSGVPTDSLVKLLYPGTSVREDVGARAADTLQTSHVTTVSEVRRLLSRLDRQFYPSPFQVRFGTEDLADLEIEGIRLVLDREDCSVSAYMLQHIKYEPHLTAVFRRFVRPGMTVIDVGANVGYYAMLAAQLVGDHGRVLAVEPYSENCRLILLSAARNGVHNLELLPLAADRDRGWSYFSTHLGSNGGLQPGSPEDLADGRGMIVPTLRLDDLFIGKVDFIKIDVEGAEARAMLGAPELIKNSRPIVTSELSEEMLQRVSGVGIEEYLSWFTALC